jgi:predicted nucleotidyltransferase component of viral defense system
MKDEALRLVVGIADPAKKLNLLREYLQAFILRSLSESEAFLRLSFVGGTALRFLFRLPRFSEDLNFSLEHQSGYEPMVWMNTLKRDLSLSGFQATLSWNDRKTVHVAWIRFAQLLQEAKMEAMPQQKLSVKLEIDTRPPDGAHLVKEIVNRHMVFAIQHHDLASLMAGKIHALITRPYTKGRDWYDLLWYGSQRPRVEPNLALLQHALNQTSTGKVLDAQKWQQHLQRQLAKIDHPRMLTDVQPFLERPQDLDLMTPSHFEKLLSQ